VKAQAAPNKPKEGAPKAPDKRAEAPSNAPRSNAPPACPSSCIAPRSAIDAVVRGVAAGLGRVPPGAVVMSRALVSDVAAPRGAELLARLTEYVAGRLGPNVAFDPAPRTVAEARATIGKGPGFVLLEPKILAGRLHLGADAYPVPVSVWARARAKKRGPVAHAFSQAPIDAEVRSFLVALELVEPKAAKFTGADPDMLALACGDLDGDGVNDVVTMNRQRVLAIALKPASGGDGSVERLREASWETLSALAPVPMRQPLGAATIVEAQAARGLRGYLDVFISDRAGSVRLGPDLELVTRLKGKAIPFGAATACTWIFDMKLGDAVTPCHERDGLPEPDKLGHRGDAIAAMRLVSARGEASGVVALRRDGLLYVRQGSLEKPLGRVGAQVAVADLDQDGAPEIATTVDTLSRKHDALEVRTLRADSVQRRYRLTVPTGVEALAACPPDGRGTAAMVLATQGQLWLVR
jgi:hypothetical protein